MTSNIKTDVSLEINSPDRFHSTRNRLLASNQTLKKLTYLVVAFLLSKWAMARAETRAKVGARKEVTIRVTWQISLDELGELIWSIHVFLSK